LAAGFSPVWTVAQSNSNTVNKTARKKKTSSTFTLFNQLNCTFVVNQLKYLMDDAVHQVCGKVTHAAITSFAGYFPHSDA